MKTIAGLGNPESRYSGTAHNLGFDAVDELARRWGLAWRLQEKFRAQVAEGQVRGVPAQLVKPMTYMNLSGDALALILRQRDWTGPDLLVVTDDVDLPIGRLRMRPFGGPGGHNGLKSMVARLGCDDFARLRIGIHGGGRIENLADYVLRKLPPEPRAQLAEMTVEAADAAEMWLAEGVEGAAAKYNGLRRFNAPDAP